MDTLFLKFIPESFPARFCPVISVVYGDLSGFMVEEVKYQLFASIFDLSPELFGLFRFAS